MFDFEQYVERFDPDSVDIGECPPGFLSVHIHLLVSP